MDIFNQFASDSTLENSGTWVTVGDAALLLARIGNVKYSKMLTELVEKNEVLLGAGDDAADKLNEDLMVEVLAKTVLLNWKGNFSYKGQPLSYSLDNAKMVLAHTDFRKLIVKQATDLANFKAKQEEEQGNV